MLGTSLMAGVEQLRLQHAGHLWITQCELARTPLPGAAVEGQIYTATALNTPSSNIGPRNYVHCYRHSHALLGRRRFGARVMKTQDGTPATRDATFLAEAGILGSTAAHRLAAAQQAGKHSTDASSRRGGEGGSSWGGSSLRTWLDPAVPITL